MTRKENLEKTDVQFYTSKIAPNLPDKVLDFHAHIWTKDHWKVLPWADGSHGGKYMVVNPEYSIEQLMSDGKTLFPDRSYNSVCFGVPTPAGDIAKSNAYLESVRTQPGIYPLLLAGRGLASRAEMEFSVREGGFYGYKVFLPWLGNDYGDITIKDMIGPLEMEIANKYGLIVLLHVPRSGRLADPVIQKEVRSYSQQYENARIVLAHCGRCYHPDEMLMAVESIKDLENVYLDTSMVMEPAVLQILFSEIDSCRVVFGTDFPVAMMRGRRVYVMNHWVDVVLEGYPQSAYRVSGNNFSATFMAYEIIMAVIRGGKMAGLSSQQISAIFYDNGMALLEHVDKGR